MYFLDLSCFVEFLFPKFFFIQLSLFGIKNRQIKKFSGKNSRFCIIVRIWFWTWTEEDLQNTSMKVLGLVKIPVG